jgi:hypothetical protein
LAFLVDLHPKRLVGDHHLVNVVAFGALKPTEVKTRTCRHDAGEHHVSAAFRAGRALEFDVDVIEQETSLCHDASLKRREHEDPQSPVLPVGGAVMGNSLKLQNQLRCSILTRDCELDEILPNANFPLLRDFFDN